MSQNQNDRDAAAVKNHGPAVYRLAFSQLRNTADAEDVYQDVFLRYVEKAPVFETADSERAWLLRVTLNCCRDLWRSPWRKRHVSLDDAGELPFTDPEEQDLHRELSKLPKKDRAILHLVYWEDMSTGQAARILGCKPATARQRLARARAKLKKILDEEESDYVGTHL